MSGQNMQTFVGYRFVEPGRQSFEVRLATSRDAKKAAQEAPEGAISLVFFDSRESAPWRRHGISDQEKYSDLYYIDAVPLEQPTVGTRRVRCRNGREETCPPKWQIVSTR